MLRLSSIHSEVHACLPPFSGQLPAELQTQAPSGGVSPPLRTQAGPWQGKAAPSQMAGLRRAVLDTDLALSHFLASGSWTRPVTSLCLHFRFFKVLPPSPQSEGPVGLREPMRESVQRSPAGRRL